MAIDIATIEGDINIGMRVAKQILPFLIGIPAFSPVATVLLAAINGIETVEKSLGLPTPEAAAQVVSHLTPNSPAAVPLQ
jgi:hypothetical protein